MTGWTLVEPCCGTAALTIHLAGGVHGLVPRQGTKWPYRQQLAALLPQYGRWGSPSAAVLTDALPWGVVVATVLRDPAAVAAGLESIVARGAAEPVRTYHSYRRAPVPTDPVQLAAELLWLQRMCFAGKSIGIRDGCWSAPGYNPTTLLGQPPTPNGSFGAVPPQGPATIRAVLGVRPMQAVVGRFGLARPGDNDCDPRTALVYLDPPYAGTTGYTSQLPRAEVVDLALDWHAVGAPVVVSEAVPVAELVDRGWTAQVVRRPTYRTPDQDAVCQRMRRAHGAEWVTCSPRPR